MDKTAHVFARQRPNGTEEELKEWLERVSTTTLVRSRSRLDVVAMMLHRLLMAWYRMHELIEYTLPYFYLYFDASPQKRGIELFAMSYDCMVNNETFRRQFPHLALDRGMLDRIGKTLAVLWQIFLMFGPLWEQMRWFLSRVCGCTADMGGAWRPHGTP